LSKSCETQTSHEKREQEWQRWHKEGNSLTFGELYSGKQVLSSVSLIFSANKSILFKNKTIAVFVKHLKLPNEVETETQGERHRDTETETGRSKQVKKQKKETKGQTKEGVDKFLQTSPKMHACDSYGYTPVRLDRMN
jgi:hypothetical protein